jgi:hypothetical protein
MYKIFEQFLAAVFFCPFFPSVSIDESFVKFLVAVFFKEEFFNHSGQIVDRGEVAKKPYNDPPVEAVDAAYDADLVHPVIPYEFSVNLEVINSHIEVDQVIALFIGEVICGCFLNSCTSKDIS